MPFSRQLLLPSRRVRNKTTSCNSALLLLYLVSWDLVSLALGLGASYGVLSVEDIESFFLVLVRPRGTGLAGTSLRLGVVISTTISHGFTLKVVSGLD